jgi:hypothetical protein
MVARRTGCPKQQLTNYKCPAGPLHDNKERRSGRPCIPMPRTSIRDGRERMPVTTLPAPLRTIVPPRTSAERTQGGPPRPRRTGAAVSSSPLHDAKEHGHGRTPRRMPGIRGGGHDRGKGFIPIPSHPGSMSVPGRSGKAFGRPSCGPGRQDEHLPQRHASSNRKRQREQASALAWWAWADLNGRPHAYQACALTS